MEVCVGSRWLGIGQCALIKCGEWETEKKRRQDEREKECVDRYKRNQDAVKQKAETKKLKSNNAAPPQSPLHPALVPPLLPMQVPISAQSASHCATCRKPLDERHRATCRKCQSVCHDICRVHWCPQENVRSHGYRRIKREVLE